LYNFSGIDDLKPLARLVSAIRGAAGGLRFLLAGAQARDLLLKYAHGINAGRQTSDVDFAFSVDSWGQFHALRESLVESGEFEATRTLHKLRYREGLEIDIVPFGGIERPDRTIEWPPNGDNVMSLFGFREVLDFSLLVALPEDQQVEIVSLQALALLKFAAWRDRRLTQPGKDAFDLRLILEHYLDAGNSERLYGEFANLFDEPDFDYERAGAYMLGNDIARLLDERGRAWLSELLAKETDVTQRLLLVGDMKIQVEKGVALLSALKQGSLGAAR
jgi:predicted nucleotidyltransferase